MAGLAMVLTLMILLATSGPAPSQAASHQNQSSAEQPAGQLSSLVQQHASLPQHFKPAFLYGARNKSVNFTHLAVDELTSSVYVGATNWLFQLSSVSLKPDFLLKTGPTPPQADNLKDCSPADCPMSQMIFQMSDPQQSLMHHAPFANDLGVPLKSSSKAAGNHTLNSYAFLAPPRTGQQQQQHHQQQTGNSQQQRKGQHNNYNKILAIDYDSKQLIVCNSFGQGACRKHQLGQLNNYSELIPMAVASNDEHSTSVALIVKQQGHGSKPIMYVAATSTKLGPYRDQVPAISARHLEPQQRAMQIIERSFTDSAQIDVSFELRDYYLINYVHSFQHNDYIYFATLQRKSPLRQFEEWGYITRLARLCLSDLSFQSYTEITLECKSRHAGRSKQQPVNYNLLQDAQLTQASSQLAQLLGVKQQSAVLVTAFAQSRDHTLRSQQRSAICLYPMERVEEKFNENIHLCYNGSAKARNMNYIAGSVNDCPKAGVSNSPRAGSNHLPAR